ncbi:MAG: hypothetical protein ABGZ17_29935, partial [Planctomycetaceae bacterium]
MLIRITCPSCGKAFQVEQRFAGRRGTCPNPKCRQDYQVPKPEAGQSQDPPLRLRTRNQVTVIEGSLVADPSRSAENPHTPRPESTPPESTPPESTPPESTPPESTPPESTPPESTRPESTPPEAPPDSNQQRTADERPGVSDEDRALHQHVETRPTETSQTTIDGASNTSQTLRDRSLSQRQRQRNQHREMRQRRRFQIACSVVVVLVVIGGLAMRSLIPPSTPKNQLVAAENAEPPPPRPQPASNDVFHDRVLPFLKKHCIDCHGAEEPMAGLTFHNVTSPDEVTGKRKRWEKILKLLRFQVMPPEDHDVQPSPAEREAAVAWLDKKLFFVDCNL